MANFKDSPKFEVHNDYYTPEYAWTNIKHILEPYKKDYLLWEACMLGSDKSQSPEYLRKMGFNVRSDTKINCLNTSFLTDKYLIITNPPFETAIKKKILAKFVELDRPFIIILNSTNIYSNYFRDIFKGNEEHLQFIIPKGKIHFNKLLDDGSLVYKKNTSFYCIYVAYKMNIPQADLFLH